MTHRKWLRHKFLDAKLLTSCILSMTLGVTQTALAGYQPPPDQKPPSGQSDSSGVRGVHSNQRGTLTLLAPATHFGRTTLHPQS